MVEEARRFDRQATSFRAFIEHLEALERRQRSGEAPVVEEGAEGVRIMAAACPELIVASSYSKNFGLYRERVGALQIVSPDTRQTGIVQSQLGSVVRGIYSMPPAHGAAVVATILGDAPLRATWVEELDSMRERLNVLRTGFSSALVRATNSDVYASLANQAGMFSVLRFRGGGIADLQKEEGIYIPGSGRTNIAGLPEDRLEEIATRIAPYLSPAG